MEVFGLDALIDLVADGDVAVLTGAMLSTASPALSGTTANLQVRVAAATSPAASAAEWDCRTGCAQRHVRGPGAEDLARTGAGAISQRRSASKRKIATCARGTRPRLAGRVLS